MDADVVIVGAGPAGLSAALILGRSRKRVVLYDAGPRRNAAAEHMHGFVTREGIEPTGFRAAAQEQLAPFDVAVRGVGAHAIETVHGGFEVTTVDGRITARRVLLATGVIDEIPDLPGIRERWGHSVHLCPYCHGWEARDVAWGLLAPSPALLEHALLLAGWSPVTVFTEGEMEIPAPVRARLAAARVQVEPRRIARLVGEGRELTGVELEGGDRVEMGALFLKPRQRQVPLVERLQLERDDAGYVRVNEAQETSIPGLHAAGDLTTHVQSAILAAAAGARAAYAMNLAMNTTR